MIIERRLAPERTSARSRNGDMPKHSRGCATLKWRICAQPFGPPQRRRSPARNAVPGAGSRKARHARFLRLGPGSRPGHTGLAGRRLRPILRDARLTLALGTRVGRAAFCCRSGRRRRAVSPVQETMLTSPTGLMPPICGTPRPWNSARRPMSRANCRASVCAKAVRA